MIRSMIWGSVLIALLQAPSADTAQGGSAQEPYSQATLEAFDQYEKIGKDGVLSRLDELAKGGDTTAMAALGELYYAGELGVEKKPKKGCDYSESAGRHPTALHNVATCYFSGRGRNQDFAQARAIYARAVEAGFQQSQCALGNMLIRGQGGAKDVERGLELCRRAASAGDINALTDLGGHILMGVSGESDPVSARFMLEEAAEQGQANAAFLLAQIHTKGDGTPVDNVEAQKWFEVAYEGGRQDAPMQIGYSLANRGFRQDDNEMFVNSDLLKDAIEWFEIATQVDPRPDRRQKAEEMMTNLQTLIKAAS